ncbi:MAG TPA: hemerythrin domain-containing protein [Terriglobales bacterium]|nr:hemerythrin domain-containing protein [Terriglobales bacterium]
MLQNIKLPTSSTAKTATPSELLLACHQRIRHFSSVAVKLAHAPSVPEGEIVQAATGLHRYFTVALPLHEADENLSLHPRLRRSVPAEELAGPAADAMVDQHLAIDELVERLVPLWQLLQSAPQKLPETAGEMCALSSRLNELFQAHLKLEEETIFPAMDKYLSDADQTDIVREMQERRGIEG